MILSNQITVSSLLKGNQSKIFTRLNKNLFEFLDDTDNSFMLNSTSVVLRIQYGLYKIFWRKTKFGSVGIVNP